MNKNMLSRFLLVVPLCTVVVLASGCGKKEEEIPSYTPPPPAKTRVVTTMGKPGSNITLYRHYISADNLEVKRETVYNDNHLLIEELYTDPRVKGIVAGKLKVKKSTETYADGTTVKTSTSYDQNGGVVSQEEYRRDRSLAKTMVLLPDGTKETKEYDPTGKLLTKMERARPDQSREVTTYRKDGKRLFSVEVFRPDQTRQATYYRKDTTLWVVLRYQGYELREIDAYDLTGTLNYKRVRRSDDTLEITFYRLEGGQSVPAFRQSWGLDRTYWWRTDQHLIAQVEEYQQDGKTPARLLAYDTDGRTLKEATSYNPDGSKKSKRYFRPSDATLEREETFDAQGNVAKEDKFEADKAIREQVDDRLLKLPAFEDPTAWNVPRD